MSVMTRAVLTRRRKLSKSHASVRGVTDRNDHGQAMIEFALTVPIVILLLILVVGLAFMLYSFVTLSSCAREGARLIMERPQATQVELAEYTKRGAGILDRDLMTVTTSPAPEARNPGANVTVAVSYPFQIVDVTVPYILAPGDFRIFPTIWLNAVSTMNLD